jgi:hypothetical protein
MGSVLPATRCNIILYAVDKQLNKDCRNQGTDKSYPQPEHIFPYTSKPKYKNAQKTHHGSEKGFQFHSTVSGERANLGRWSRLKIVPGEPSLKGPKQQLFKSHPSHLPKVEFLLIRIQLALALVVKGEGHIEHRIAFITPHQNRVLGKAEYYRSLAQVSCSRVGRIADCLAGYDQFHSPVLLPSRSVIVCGHRQSFAEAFCAD